MQEYTGTIDITHLQDQVERLDAVRARIASLKEQEKVLVAHLRAGLGTYQIGTVSGEEAIRIDSRVNTHLDRDAVKALIGPELLGSVTRLSPYVTVKVVGKFRASK